MVSGRPYGSVNSKHAHPPSGICRVFGILLVLAGGGGGVGRGKFVRKPLPEGEYLSIPVEAVYIVPFSIFHF